MAEMSRAHYARVLDDDAQAVEHIARFRRGFIEGSGFAMNTNLPGISTLRSRHKVRHAYRSRRPF